MTGIRTRVVNPAQLRRRRLFPSTRKMLYPVGRCSRDNSFYPRKHDMREMNNDIFSPRKSDGEVFRDQQYSWWSRKQQRRHRRGTNVDKTNKRMGGHRSTPSEKPPRADLVITFSNSILGSDSDSNLLPTRRVELKPSAPSQMTDTLAMEENDQIASADFTVDANNNVDCQCHCEAYSETCYCQQSHRCTSSDRVQTCSLFNTPCRPESHEGYTHTQSPTDNDMNADCEEWMMEDFEAQWQAGLEDLKTMSPERYRFYCEEV